MTPIPTMVAPDAAPKTGVSAHYEQQLAQEEFMQRGGTPRIALGKKYKSGELSPDYEYREFPKCLNLSCGMRDVPWQTETVKGATLHGVETREMIAIMRVEDAEEEADTRAAYDLAREMGVEIEPSWDAATLRQVVKQHSTSRRAAARVAAQTPAEVDAEAAKASRIAALQAELAELTALTEGDAPDINPLAAPSSSPARRPHRRTRPPEAGQPPGDAEPLDEQQAA
jgi:hypothetical protein